MGPGAIKKYEIDRIDFRKAKAYNFIYKIRANPTVSLHKVQPFFLISLEIFPENI
jgi:hypothetical protein